MNDSTKPGKIIEGVCFSTEHIYKNGSVEIPYLCDAQEFIFVDECGEPEASFFIYSYLRKDVENKDRRPVIFDYSGGPGNSSTPLSIWGPKMIDTEFNRCTGPYPEPVDNPDWLIDVADIVCLDPPGTGYGHIYQYEKRLKYWGMQPDVIAFIDIFKFWLSKYDRWYSPKYIAGISYGGMRTAMLADMLCGGPFYTEQRQLTHGIALNGAIVCGSSLDFDPRNPENLENAGLFSSTANTLATYAAINWHWNPSGKPGINEFIEEAERFACDEFLRAQWLGNDMAQEERTRFLEKYSYYCGLPAALLATLPNYELDPNQFLVSYLADDKKRLSLYDGRLALSSVETLGFFDDYADDPVNSGGTFRLAPMVRKYYKDFLGIKLDREWIEMNFDINFQWTWSSNRTMIQHLESAMRRNPDMYALVYGGMYDLAAASGANRYAIRHSNIDKSRVLMHDDPYAGHGVGMNAESIHEYAQWIRKLIEVSIA